MSADSMFVLVQVGSLGVQNSVASIIRTYQSHERAMEDIELLRVTNPSENYRIIDVPHIER